MNQLDRNPTLLKMIMNYPPSLTSHVLPLLLLNDYPALPSDSEENYLYQTLFRLVLRHGQGRLDGPAPGGGRILSCPLGGACALSLQRPDESGGLALLAWENLRSGEVWAEFLKAHQELHQGHPTSTPARPRQTPLLAISLSPRLLARATAAEIQSVLAELAGAGAALLEYHTGRQIWN